MFELYLDNFSYKNHSFLGIGVLKEDLKYVSLRNKILCLGSLTGSGLTNIIPGLKHFSDSLYVTATKKGQNNLLNLAVDTFMKSHKQDATNNLNIIPLLKCPIHGSDIELSDDKKKAISKGNGIYYPIENSIPIMIDSEHRTL